MILLRLQKSYQLSTLYQQLPLPTDYVNSKKYFPSCIASLGVIIIYVAKSHFIACKTDTSNMVNPKLKYDNA